MFVISQWEDVQPEDYNYYAAFFAGVAIVPAVFAFYTQYYLLFPRFLQKRQWAKATIYGIGLALVATLAGNITIALADEEALNCLLTCLPYGPLFTFGVALVFSIIGLVLRGFLTWIEELKLKEELVEKNHKMELALVKAQLDPHFLFNTINNIDVLITKDPNEASRYLNQLSDMMRFMLYETKSEHIPLEQEMSYIDKYVELQRIRTANKNYVQYEVEGQPGGKQVAPMIFIPFIENAFKHATNKKLDQAVDIRIQIEEKAIVFSCQNRFEPHRKQQNGANGLGNELIQRRLELLYPETHSLEVKRRNDEYQVDLTLVA